VKALAAAAAAVIGLPLAVVMLTAMSAAPQSCPGQPAGRVAASGQARESIPVTYLVLYRKAGQAYRIAWQVLAGIGEVESDHGRAALPGVRAGQNGFGAAGPMQIGIGGRAGDTWGGPAIHRAGQPPGGVGTDGDGDGIDNVYDPADAIPAAARYLAAHGAPGDMPAAVFAYNHSQAYVQDVLSWASKYTRGGVTAAAASLGDGSCASTVSVAAPGRVAAAAIAYAEKQIGKPYLWGGTGPAAFDCSGLVMMAYRAAGLTIPRTSQQQWAWGPRVQPGHEQPGDLVFFAGADGTAAAPGHVGMVIGRGEMIDALETGVPVAIQPFSAAGAVAGFTRPGAHTGIPATPLTGQG
jgi:peptidoglycan DL-endopeptidase CwlO